MPFNPNFLPPFLILLTLMTGVPFPRTEAAPGPGSSRGSQILREELNRINATQFTTGSFMMRWMERTKNELHLCEDKGASHSKESLKCLKRGLLEIAHTAYNEKIISPIEHEQIAILLRKLTLKDDGKLEFKKIEPSLLENLLGRSGRRTLVPSLSTYESRANHFRRLRIENGRPESLDPEVNSLLRKLYHRKIVSLGRVSPDQYLLARYSVTQINLMSELLTDTLRWMDDRAMGQILLDSSGVEVRKDRINGLKDRYVRLSIRGASPAELRALSDEISSLENEVSAQDTLARILALRDEAYQVARNISESPSPDELPSLRARLSSLEQELELLQEQLESERLTLPLSAGDLHRASMNRLEAQMESMRRRPGALERFDGNLADLLVAGYLTGAVDGAELKAILSVPDFVEHHESFLLKSGKLVWRAGRMYLMLNPYTVIPTTMISVVVSALQQKKEYERASARKTHLIRQ